VLELDVSELLAFIGVRPSSVLPPADIYFRKRYGMTEEQARAAAELIEERYGGPQEHKSSGGEQMNRTTHHETIITVPGDLVRQLRAPIPKRRLTYAEGQNLAKLQARRARSLLHMTAPHADLRWVLRLPEVRVKAMPAHEVHEIAQAECSGFTKRLRGGGYFIAVNKNASTQGDHTRWEDQVNDTDSGQGWRFANAPPTADRHL